MQENENSKYAFIGVQGVCLSGEAQNYMTDFAVRSYLNDVNLKDNPCKWSGIKCVNSNKTIVVSQLKD